MKIAKQSKQALDLAAKTINNGGVVVCPTDTVYGFLAAAENKRAVEKIFKLKQRPRSKPLPVFVCDFKMANELAEINEKQSKILNQKWPGKYTFILKFKTLNPNFKLFTKNGTIALRIPKYKFLNDLLKKINRPLAQTSVNISGQPPLTKIPGILEKFRATSEVALIINAGNLPKSKPSAIIDLTGKHLTRIR
jgi:L-threonylcarbamoyladenylate synthase